MPRLSATTPAQQSRDQGLARLRRLTLWAGAWAAGLAAIASLIAANTIPGRNLNASQAPAATAAPGTGTSGDNGGAAVTDPNQQPNLNPPAQLPQGGSGGGPVVVSGSS